MTPFSQHGVLEELETVVQCTFDSFQASDGESGAMRTSPPAPFILSISLLGGGEVPSPHLSSPSRWFHSH